VQDLPEALAVGADYGLALLSPRPEAVRLALFALSPAGQAILARHGFAPVTDPR
jgi:ABC-type molybdate transport system substrate-binding protein